MSPYLSHLQAWHYLRLGELVGCASWNLDFGLGCMICWGKSDVTEVQVPVPSLGLRRTSLFSTCPHVLLPSRILLLLLQSGLRKRCEAARLGPWRRAVPVKPSLRQPTPSPSTKSLPIDLWEIIAFSFIPLRSLFCWRVNWFRRVVYYLMNIG